MVLLLAVTLKWVKHPFILLFLFAPVSKFLEAAIIARMIFILNFIALDCKIKYLYLLGSRTEKIWLEDKGKANGGSNAKATTEGNRALESKTSKINSWDVKYLLKNSWKINYLTIDNREKFYLCYYFYYFLVLRLVFDCFRYRFKNHHSILPKGPK